MGRIPLRGRWRAQWRPLLVGVVIGALGVAAFAVIVVPPALLTHRSEWPGEHVVAEVALSIAARLHAPTSVAVPLTDRAAIERGRSAYTGSCAQCHGTKGDGTDGALSKTLFPPATDLTKGDAKEKSDADLFWATKSGLSFTAMPAFASQFNDDALRSIVAYLRQLQHAGAGAQSSVVPTPSTTQLIKADPAGDAVARGGAVYFAQNCALCHGGQGDAPGELRLRSVASDDSAVACQIRNGPNGMPAYSASMISDAQMANLIAFLHSVLPTEQPRQPGARPPGVPTATDTPRPAGPPRDAGTQAQGGPGRDVFSNASAASGTFSGCGG